MKLFTQWRFILLSALFSLIGMGSAWAQLIELEEGGVYHFTNVGYPAKAMVATTPSSIAGVTADNTNKAQLWYVETSQVKEGVTYYALRNLGYGTYLQGNGKSSAWTLANTTGSDKSWFALTLANGKTAIRSYNERSNNHGFAHIDGSSNVVGWSTDAQATQWNISKIEMSSADIQTALGIFGNVASYQTALDALFTDKACTELKVTFDENNASFKELHPTLQNMVRKVAGTTSWEEANKDNTKESWGADYAKKYRVQLYEPYNDAGAAASALGLNAHNSLNNPTGIFANNGDVLYVMVDGEIKEGASLYLAYYTGHGKLDASSKVGYELKQGLNVIPVYQNSSNFCVNYVVQTFDTSDGKKGNKAKARKLSDYDPIKIHIEGGYINGYYNKMGDELYGSGDKSADWDYIEARATQKDVTVLGQYITLQFPLNDADTEGNQGLGSYFNELVNIEPVIDEWDNVMLWERLLLGVLDKETIEGNAKKSPYSDKDYVFAYTGDDTDGFGTDYGDYYNVHGLSFGVGGDAYMYGGWDHCGYHYNTMGGVIKNLPTDAGSHWGPGHEIGHQHQNLLTVNGLTEVTNNLFSNVVLWYFGETTSRYNGTEGALSNVLAQFNAEGTDFFSNNIWAQTIMYYKLFLYYHVLGHNPKFYPRLFEMLRQDPMSTGYAQDGSTCLMHFYKKCCLAAGEDLTEFFRAHGFFEVMDNRLVGDYSNSVYTLTQEQIDAAIKEVKDLKYEENLAVLFINDATGETIKSYKGDNLAQYGETTICSEIGSYASFTTATTPSYNYAISGNTVTMEGSGGVGFAILNEKGELIGFSDKKTFEISAEAAAAIASGKASIVTLNADNTPVAATNVMDTGNTEEKYELLGELLGSAKQLLDLSDATGTKVGYYRASSLTNLQEAYESAKAVYDAQTVAAYSAVYDVLYQEYANLMNNDYARVNITEGYAYRLTNKAYPGRSMAVNTENNQMSGIATAESDAQLWYFEPGTTAGTYYLKNKGTSLYPASASSGAVLKADKEESTKGEKGGAAPYTLQNMGNGVFALSNGSGLHCSSSQSYNIVGWGTDAAATQWYITANALDEALEARTKLEELIGKTDALVNEIAEYTLVNKLELQTEDNSAANYLSTNACHNTLNNENDGGGLEGLLDESTGTYFHSDYRGKVTDPHYLQVDLGENNTVEQFKFNYTTRGNGNNCPLTIKVEGSTDGSTFVELKTFTATNDGLPNGNALSWESPAIRTVGNYRHLRFTVTEAEGSNIYFVMSTFGVSDVTPVVDEIKDGYANDDASKDELKDQIKATLYELANAHQLVDGDVADASEYNEEFQTLDPYYQELLTVVNNKLKAALDAKKAELQKWIDDANALITECGTVTFTPGTYNGVPKLQTTDENDRFYIWTNAQELDEGPIANLVDGNLNSYFHSDYSGTNSTDKLDHHLTVNLGTGVTASSFQFSYTTRHNADTNYPTTIQVYGSTDGTDYEEVTTITGLPTGNTKTYNSETITAENKAFTHLRFMVTANSNTDSSKGIKGGHPIFHMAEFSLTIIGRPENYSVTLNNNIGIVDEALLVAAYKEKEEAVYVKANAITETQIDEAIAELQAQYNALLEAKNADPLRAERETANEFLNSTPETVGYPVAAERKNLQKAIAEATTAAAIDAAVLAFKITANINMPENGKAYKIKAWWKNEQRYMTFIQTEDASVFAGSESAYVPVQDKTKAVTFVCRKIGDDNDNTYAFVSDKGYYLGWQADGKKNNTSQNFAVNGYDNTLKIQKGAVNNNGTILSLADLFGTLNILGKNANEGGVYYHFMFNKSSKNYHSGNLGDMYYYDDKHTVYYTFEEDTNYSLNKVNLTATSTDRDKLLKGIADQQTISTFSAPYATVIPDGVTAYYASKEYDGNMLYLKAIEAGLALPANEGVILVGNEDVKASDFVPATTETVAVIVNEFSNSAAASVVMENNDYILANGNEGIGIYKAQKGTRLKQGKAFLRMGSTSNAPRFIMNFGGNTTGVEITLTDGATGEQVVYDLYGRRVTEVTKGRLYIVNGKKVFIK